MPNLPSANPTQFIQGAAALHVLDVKATATFYRDVLGFNWDFGGDACHNVRRVHCDKQPFFLLSYCSQVLVFSPHRRPVAEGHPPEDATSPTESVDAFGVIPRSITTIPLGPFRRLSGPAGSDVSFDPTFSSAATAAAPTKVRWPPCSSSARSGFGRSLHCGFTLIHPPAAVARRFQDDSSNRDGIRPLFGTGVPI